ncbi:TetR/AcrR family transcriptional regulator [Streptomyces sp. NPDC058657]|uniref:TetR/AcrR family transcriptional regulator n=1 Tax=unclassified Streptomyces TaxID=2593676 RepID=UPI00364D92C1
MPHADESLTKPAPGTDTEPCAGTEPDTEPDSAPDTRAAGLPGGTDADSAPGTDPQRLWLGSGTSRSGRGRKPAFSRGVITAAAVALADAEGLEAVTMRRVAAEVGAGVMSLYSYAPDKETLLELMVDHVSGELAPAVEPSGDWRADLKAIGHLQRGLMHRHPWLPAALGTRRSLGPHSLAFLEHALAALRPTGLDGATKLEVFSQLTGFVAAYAGHEIAQSAATTDPGRLAAELRYLAAVAADGRHPELAAALAAPARPQSPDAMFTRFLDRLIDGLDSESPGAVGPGPTSPGPGARNPDAG